MGFKCRKAKQQNGRIAQFKLRAELTNLLRAELANLLTNRIVTSSSVAAAFSATAPKIWNTLPDHLRAPCSIPVFKSGLKTHLFRQAFDSCDIH